MTHEHFQQSVLAEAREYFQNPALRRSHVLNWASYKIPEEANEITVFLPRCKVYLCILKKWDKRRHEKTQTFIFAPSQAAIQLQQEAAEIARKNDSESVSKGEWFTLKQVRFIDTAEIPRGEKYAEIKAEIEKTPETKDS